MNRKNLILIAFVSAVIVFFIVFLILLESNDQMNYSSQNNPVNKEDSYNNDLDIRNKHDNSRMIKIGVMDYPPYEYMEGINARGISIEILETALNELGYEYQFISRPWSRILEEAESGSLDIFMDSYDVFDRRSYVSYSSYPLSSYTLSIYKNIDSKLSYDGTFNSLKGYTFGSIRDYNYSSQLQNAIEKGVILTKNTDNPEDNFINLEKGLIDYTIEDKNFGDNYLINNNFKNIVEDPKPYDHRYTYFAFSNSNDMIEVRIKVDELLEKYYQDGTIENIYARYNLEDSYKDLKMAMINMPPIKRFDYALQTEPVKIGVLGYTPPYSYREDDELKGIYIDLISEAMDRTHIKYEFVELPFARILELVKTGNLNIGVDIFMNEERKIHGLFLEEYPIAEYAYALCSRNDSNMSYNGDINSLKGKSVGIVRGYSLGKLDYIYDDSGFNFDYADDTNKLLNNLINKRIDYAIEVKTTAEISLLELGYSNDIKIDDNFDLSNLSYMYFSNDELSEALMDELGASLNEMKNDGTIEMIFIKYDLIDAMPRVYK